MTYQDAMDYIDNLVIIGKKAGLENIKMLLEEIGNPQIGLNFVHIAGTNGKGSTTAMTASVLKSSGYKTGMYISPFVIDFRERIQINDVMISQDDFLEAFEIVKPVVDKMNSKGEFPNHFEVITAVAMLYFKKMKCDIIVLEVGLGGRYDATNVIDTPLVAAITSISLDHTYLLGDTIAKIAYEKCGIIKENATVVSYPEQFHEALEVIKEVSKEKNAKLIIADKNEVQVAKISIDGIDVIFNKMQIRIPFIAKYQVNNFITAMAIIKELRNKGFVISDCNIKKGIEITKFPARMEVVSKNPTVIIDGAHNPDGALALSQALDCITDKKVAVIMGMLKDKDYHSAVETIAKKASRFIAVTPNNPRAIGANELLEIASKFCENAYAEENLLLAYEKVLANSNKDEIILICGSLYLASEIRNYILSK
ncbi:MAG: folylpolyglutamate synthase/dihydrofolate synthase family protein [Oscillospiraceae bacterium]